MSYGSHLNMYYIHVAMYLLKESLFIVLQSSNYVVKPNKNDVYLRMCRNSIVSWSPNIRGFGGAIFSGSTMPYICVMLNSPP